MFLGMEDAQVSTKLTLAFFVVNFGFHDSCLSFLKVFIGMTLSYYFD